MFVYVCVYVDWVDIRPRFSFWGKKKGERGEERRGEGRGGGRGVGLGKGGGLKS